MSTMLFFVIWSLKTFSLKTFYLRDILQFILQESYTEAWEGNLGGGIVFRVHPKDEMPDVERYGLSVGAGMQANIGIQKFTVS